jgi:hypothetical protein
MHAWVAGLIGALCFVSACSSEEAPNAPTPSAPQFTGTPVRVLMVTATYGFRHDSIATARDVMASLAATTREFTVTATEDLAQLTTANLQNYDVLFFALTSGELPLSTDQKAATVNFVSGGKGFMGAHSATDTLYEWADYGRLVGAYFNSARILDRRSVCCCGSTPPPFDRAETIHSHGRNHLATVARTTTLSATSPAHGRISGSSARFLVLFGG